jgi:UDP-N-acetylmuramate--alanine ligase
MAGMTVRTNVTVDALPRYHFSGIAGAGMNPLAQLMRVRGHAVQGSDRSLDQGKNAELAARLRVVGITLQPHDGSAVTGEIDRFVYSTAVEAETPEMQAAAALGLERVARPALLAEVVNAGRPGVAIAGTSGKSTITGMLAWMLRRSGTTGTAIGGAALVGEGTSGCLVPGPDDGPVVAEACESDGTLIGYRPGIGLIHNVSRDHAEIASLRTQFMTFAAQCGKLLVNARCAEAATIGRAVKALTYGLVDGADAVVEAAPVGPDRARGALRFAGVDITLDVPQPGLHNVDNAAAAALVALQFGLAVPDIEAALATFPGVARRYEVIGTTAAGIRVVDDFAHNAEKIRAAITTAQARGARIVAVFQPHGYGPARFLRAELKELLPQILRREDRFCYAEVYYAGGTVAKDVTGRTLAVDLPPGLRCGYAPDHAAVRDWVVSEARPGDTVLLMGARDPDLPALARSVFASLV